MKGNSPLLMVLTTQQLQQTIDGLDGNILDNNKAVNVLGMKAILAQ